MMEMVRININAGDGQSNRDDRRDEVDQSDENDLK